MKARLRLDRGRDQSRRSEFVRAWLRLWGAAALTALLVFAATRPGVAATPYGSDAVVRVAVEQLGRASLTTDEQGKLKFELVDLDGAVAVGFGFAELAKEPASPGQEPCTGGLDCHADVGVHRGSYLLQVSTPPGVVADLRCDSESNSDPFNFNAVQARSTRRAECLVSYGKPDLPAPADADTLIRIRKRFDVSGGGSNGTVTLLGLVAGQTTVLASFRVDQMTDWTTERHDCSAFEWPHECEFLIGLKGRSTGPLILTEVADDLNTLPIIPCNADTRFGSGQTRTCTFENAHLEVRGSEPDAVVRVAVEQLGRTSLTADQQGELKFELVDRDGAVAVGFTFAELVKEPAPPGQEPCTGGLDCHADIGVRSGTYLLQVSTPPGVIAALSCDVEANSDSDEIQATPSRRAQCLVSYGKPDLPAPADAQTLIRIRKRFDGSGGGSNGTVNLLEVVAGQITVLASFRVDQMTDRTTEKHDCSVFQRPHECEFLIALKGKSTGPLILTEVADDPNTLPIIPCNADTRFGSGQTRTCTFENAHLEVRGSEPDAVVRVAVEQLGRASLTADEQGELEFELVDRDGAVAVGFTFAELVKEPAPPGQEPCTGGLGCHADIGVRSGTYLLQVSTPPGVIAALSCDVEANSDSDEIQATPSRRAQCLVSYGKPDLHAPADADTLIRIRKRFDDSGGGSNGTVNLLDVVAGQVTVLASFRVDQMTDLTSEKHDCSVFERPHECEFLIALKGKSTGPLILTEVADDPNTLPIIPCNGDTRFGSGQTRTCTFENAHLEVEKTATVPSVAIGDVTVTEGNSGAANATVTVTRSPAAGGDVTVAYSTSGGTASANVDYTPVLGLLVIPDGQATATFTVPSLGDVLDENDETVTVKLNGSSNATIADSTGTITILDNDPLPTLAIGNASVTEGDSGASAVNVPVTLTPASGRAVSVSFATANGTAVAGSDYLTTSGSLTIPAGATSRTIAIQIMGDTVAENTESFFVNSSSAPRATIADAQGLVTILDTDDKTPPAIAPKGEVMVEARLLAGQTIAVTYASPTAVDNLDGAVKVDCLAVSGTQFPLGTTTVVCTARDRAGNLAQSRFSVTVRQPTTAGAVTNPGNIKKPLTQVAPRQRVRVRAGGYAPGSSIQLRFLTSSGELIDIGTTTARADGHFDVRTKIPGCAAPGPSQVMAFGNDPAGGDFIRIWLVTVVTRRP